MQKAKLKLPVKQFHQLHDFLGDILDHEAETNDFNLENADIDLIENVRTELFNQIPDEKPTEATYVWTSSKGASSITPIKMYEVKFFSESKVGFHINNDRGNDIFCIEKGCAHLSSDQSKNWNFITITND